MTASPVASTARADVWQLGDAYERYMGRWSRQVAPRFLQWLNIAAARRWLDVGCGTGALSSAIVEHCAPRSVIGVDPSQGFLAAARARLPALDWRVGSADELPLTDESVDVAASALVLNFVPDPVAALREMARVTAPDGEVGVYVWDYSHRMALVRHYWDAAARVDPAVVERGQDERFALCHPENLSVALIEAGLRSVTVSAIDIELRFTDFDDYWQPFLAGQGPAPAHAMRLQPAQREHLRELLRARLPVRADGTIVLNARAWAGRGIRR